MKPIIVHSDAERELWQAADYYEAKRVGLGLELEREVSRAFFDIQEAPGRWPKRRYQTRYRLLRRFPYAVHYLELHDSIWVVAIAHSSRKPYYWRKRIKK